jgi:hypothetical protein
MRDEFEFDIVVAPPDASELPSRSQASDPAVREVADRLLRSHGGRAAAVATAVRPTA